MSRDFSDGTPDPMKAGESLRRRPGVVWCVSAYCTVVAGVSIWGNVLMVSSGLFRIGLLQYARSVSLIALLLTGAFLLFKLRKGAVVVLGLVVVVSFINRLAQFLFIDAAVIHDAWRSVLWELGVESLIFFRAVQLRKEGILS